MNCFLIFINTITAILLLSLSLLLPSNHIFAQIIDNATDNTTDNSTDNTTDNTTEDNETMLRLYELFATAKDNYTCESPAQPLSFPYLTGLETCVRQHFSHSRLSCGDAATLKKLECNDPTIKSLDGLQQFPNLEIIMMPSAGSKISDLSPIRNLMYLRTLSIPYADITEIGWLAYLDRLVTLNLQGNSVTNLEYMPLLSSLRELVLDYQAPDYITDISTFIALRNLSTLSLQGNKITDISALDNLTNMKNLMLRDNRITSLEPLDNLTRMQTLNFSVNMVTDITPLDNLTDLTYISGNNNRISDISALDNLTKLITISFKQNFISDIAPVANKSKIKEIVLDYNTITDLSPIYDIMWYTTLAELGLAYNCITKDNYRQVRYLEDIYTLRLDHQCETYPTYYPEDEYVVNGDLVNATDSVDNDIIYIPQHEAQAGVACSIMNGKPNDLLAFLFPFILAIYVLLRRKFNL